MKNVYYRNKCIDFFFFFFGYPNNLALNSTIHTPFQASYKEHRLGGQDVPETRERKVQLCVRTGELAVTPAFLGQ